MPGQRGRLKGRRFERFIVGPDQVPFDHQRALPLRHQLHRITPTHADQEVREARLLAARVVTSDLIEKGVAAFSPIVYSRSLAESCDTAPVDGWYEFDLNFLALAEGMTILELPGWESSPGILLELAFAKARDIPVELLGWGEIRPLLEEETIRALEQGLGGR